MTDTSNSTVQLSIWRGFAAPRGVSWDDREAYNFAIFARNATQVELLIFAASDIDEPLYRFRLDPRRNKSGDVWHCGLPADAIEGQMFYAYSVSGPNLLDPGDPAHAYSTAKVLLDPYATCVWFPPSYDVTAAIGTGPNMGRAPLALLHAHQDLPPVRDLRALTVDIKETREYHRHLQEDLVVCELHVKGFTASPSSGVAAGVRGTYSGLIDKIPYLKELGVTAVELMPVFQGDHTSGNYWNYSPLAFFAPNAAYSASHDLHDQQAEFKSMVDAFHDADIDVILDVVFNHTCEGDQRGPRLSFKGIDAASYYIGSGNPDGPYMNYSGTGNTLDSSASVVRQLVVDSMRYWVQNMGVDGFRFDLASVFTRQGDGSVNTASPAIFGDIATDPALAGVHLIAEPWDAAGAYQLGESFPGLRWLQWNGKFRDVVQQFVKSDPGKVAELMTRVYGSSDLFPDTVEHSYHPYQSVNYFASHDGFTLYDLTAYNEKRNWANGENNKDGPNDNSWNCGWEGDDDVPTDVLALRHRQARNFFALLMVSVGTPMFRAGDEFLQTQGGNNNPYNQDNETSWLDWTRSETNADMVRFVRGLIALRLAHPALRRSVFLRDHIEWYGADGGPDLSTESRSVAWCVRGASVGDVDIFVVANAWWETLEMALPAGDTWSRVVDTSLPSPDDIVDVGSELPVSGASYTVAPRSIVILTSQTPKES